MAEKSPQADTGSTVYLTRLALQDIRAFDDFTINFTDVKGEPRMRTLIIGRNGTNKTTLLRSIVLGLVAYPDAQSLLGLPNGIYQSEKTTDKARIETLVHLKSKPQSKGNSIEIKRYISRNDRSSNSPTRERLSRPAKWEDEPVDPEGFIVAYGTSRSMIGTDSGRDYREYDSVQTLFRNDARLIDTELTLRRMQDYKGTDLYERVLPGIKRVLGLPEDAEIRFAQGGGVEVTGPGIGKAIPLEGWADGYRLTFQWIIDLYAWGIRAGQVTEAGGVRGILLIDEIEQHLHPSLQTQLLDKLSGLFPELQIIATTHSPLVALGAKPEELVVLRRNGDKVEQVQNVPDYRGYSVEDVVADDLLFDSPVFSPEMTEKLQRYEELASQTGTTQGLEAQGDEGEFKRLARELQETPESQKNDDQVIQQLREIQKKLK